MRTKLMAKMDMDIIKSDVLIIGSGIAGLRAALEVSKRGKRALLVSKSPAGKANNTYLAEEFLLFQLRVGMSRRILKKHFRVAGT